MLGEVAILILVSWHNAHKLSGVRRKCLKDLGRLAYMSCLQLFPKVLKSMHAWCFIDGEICFTRKGMWERMIRQSAKVLEQDFSLSKVDLALTHGDIGRDYSQSKIEWPRKIHGHGGAKEIPCSLETSAFFKHLVCSFWFCRSFIIIICQSVYMNSMSD